jgi:hypothetical protein
VQSIPYAAAVVVSLVSSLHLPGHWIGEARDTWIAEPVVLEEVATVASEPVNAALSAATRSGDNGGALPATAKLDSAK